MCFVERFGSRDVCLCQGFGWEQNMLNGLFSAILVNVKAWVGKRLPKDLSLRMLANVREFVGKVFFSFT